MMNDERGNTLTRGDRGRAREMVRMDTDMYGENGGEGTGAAERETGKQERDGNMAKVGVEIIGLSGLRQRIEQAIRDHAGQLEKTLSEIGDVGVQESSLRTP